MSRRDPLIDLLRAGALLVVVAWHWVFTTIRWTSSGPRVGNPVAVTPGLWLLTWVLQIMPAFFMIGGFLHSTNDLPATSFWAKRLQRLVVPVLPLLIPAGALAAWYSAIGRHDLVKGVILVISPMWFLATYVICVLFAPVAQRLHRSIGPWAVALGLVIVATIDHVRIGLGLGGALTGALAFVSVWLTVHQMGYSMGQVLSTTKRNQIRLAGLGYTLLGIAAAVFPYPAAMVGLDGHKLSNMGPPTLMVVLLAIGQLGLIGLCSQPLRAFASRRQGLLRAMGNWSMTVYAWHLCAYAVFWWLLLRFGYRVGATVDTQWWLQRPVWFIGPLALAVPICRLTRRFDRSSNTRSVEVERLQTHLITNRLDRRVRQGTSLPVRSIDHQGVARDEARVR